MCLSMPAPNSAHCFGRRTGASGACGSDSSYTYTHETYSTALLVWYSMRPPRRVRPSRDRCRRGGDGRIAEERKRFSHIRLLAELRRCVRMRQTPTLTHVQPVLEERLARDARRAVCLANAVPDHVESASNTSAARPVRAKSLDAHSLCVATALVPVRPVNTVVGDCAPTCSAGRWPRRSDSPCTTDSLADSVAHCRMDPGVVINIGATEDQRMVPTCVDVSTAGVQGEKASPHRFRQYSRQLISDPTCLPNFAGGLRLLPAVPDHCSVDDHCLRNTQSV